MKNTSPVSIERVGAAEAAARTRKPLNLLPYFLIAPTLILVILFTIYPAVGSVISSLYRPPRNVRDPSTFVGLENYVDLFDPAHYIGSTFLQVMGNTIIFALATVIVSVPLALGFALLLNRRIKRIGVYRFSLFYPALLPMIGAASIWAFLFADPIGLVNTILRSFGTRGQNWIGDPSIVLFTVTAVNIWKQAGFYMIFYLAGLQNIPRDLYEAAELDGAGERQKLLYLTIPLLRRTTLFILIVSFTFGFQTVEHLQALGQGGPGNQSNLLLYFIFQSIGERRNWGYINAMTVLLVLVLMVFTVTNFLYFERRRDED
jgi:sn-glycerol 3-phosphate transport system permease protein